MLSFTFQIHVYIPLMIYIIFLNKKLNEQTKNNKNHENNKISKNILGIESSLSNMFFFLVNKMNTPYG